DDDPPEIRVSNPAIAEGNNGTTNLSFAVTLWTSDSNVVSVGFLTAPGTATPGVDYVSTNGLLVFQPGETNQVVLAQVIGDTLPEVHETLFLYLTNAVNGTLPLPGGTGTIVDDDAPCLS